MTIEPAGRSSIPRGVRPTRGDAVGSVVFDGPAAGKVWPLEPGTYTVNLRGRDGTVASSTITVRDPAARPVLALDAETYAPGEAITAAFRNAPGNATDWVGLYQVGETPGANASRFWQYVGGGQSPSAAPADGSVTFSSQTPGEGAASWPPAPGSYVAYLFEEDGYRILDQVPFTVSD